MDGARFVSPARIGPNAILQLIPVLDAALGQAGRQALFDVAHVATPPSDAGMLPEGEVVRLHGAVVQALPDLAPDLLRKAGLGTAEYILANRIPAPAKRVIRILPQPWRARLLARSIAKHAWTFAGSGQFCIDGYGPLRISIAENPLAVGQGLDPSCHWHAAVFERLFSSLVWPKVQLRETACCAAGHDACRFEICAQI